ncbi:preprotein translocase subunit SecE [Malacoplasma muris]|uniref:preprotein translocase subunit SecE n=1 Tax=Malacoplasma muris TaxID=2119 RepID=UPI00398E9EC2
MAKEEIIVTKKNKREDLNNDDKQIDPFASETQTKKFKKFKKFFYGVGKEFERTSWTTKSKLVSDFFVVVIIVLILAAIFTGIGLLMVTYVK